MRFIHTSDWHLGRLFYGRHLTEDQSYVLEQLHAVVRDTRPDAVLISGDIYDRAVPPTEAVELLDDTLSRLLLDARVKVVMIAGNHDSPERVGFGSKLLERQGLYVTGRLAADFYPVVLEDAFGSVYVMPFTYAEPALARSLFAEPLLDSHDAALRFLVERALRRVPAGARKVALAHAFVAGGAASESERPLSVGASGCVDGRIFAPFCYAALGHLHGPQRAGAETIRYSGSLMKYSFDEAAQKKGVELVEIGADGAARRETAPLAPRRDVRRIEGTLEEILRDRTRYPATEDYLLVSLTDHRAVLDARARLAQIYPNLMQIERPNLLVSGAAAEARGDCRAKGESALFADFFRAMTGQALDERQQRAFDESYEALLAAQREVKA